MSRPMIDRRTFLELAAAVPGLSVTDPGRKPWVPGVSQPTPFELEEATIADLQAGMTSGKYTARSLVTAYLQRIEVIDRKGPTLRSVLEVNPDALSQAAALDAERKAKGPRGPLHGIPILVKDNVATRDRMQSTAGSLALMGVSPPRDAFLVERLRAAGAVLLGKANLSEWANFRSTHSSSGWSGRGGQCRNPYALDRTPSGSSSGSGGPGGRGGGEPVRGRHRDRDRRLHRVALDLLLDRGHQADARPREPGRRHPHPPQPGHRGSHGPHGRRRGDPAGRAHRRGSPR